MTFRTLEGFDKSVENGTTFESVKYPGYYLTAEDGKLLVTQNPDSAACTFIVDTEEKEEESAELSSIAVRKTDRTYVAGETLNKSDIRLTAYFTDSKIRIIKDGFKVDDSAVDMTRPGVYKLKVTYEADGKVFTGTTNIRVVKK
nr:bacterial Ig-like domain-containing protein [Lachnospiraceae bacterium]